MTEGPMPVPAADTGNQTGRRDSTVEPFPALRRRHPNAIVVTLLAMIPGLGHVACGLYVRGLVFFLAVSSLMALTTPDTAGEALVVVAVFAWVYSMIDAARHAVLARNGRARDLLSLSHLRRVPGLGAIAGGTVLLVVSLLAALNVWFHVDLSWLVTLWPAGVMAVGALLIWAGVRERRSARSKEDQRTGREEDGCQWSRGP